MFEEQDLFEQECFLTVQPNLMPTDSHQILYTLCNFSLKTNSGGSRIFQMRSPPQGRGTKQLSPNMTLKLENELCCIKHCCSVYEQNSIVNSVRVDDRTTYKVITSGNMSKFFQKTA